MNPFPRKSNLLRFGLFQKILLSFLIAIVPMMVVGYFTVSKGENIIRQEIESSLHSRVNFYLDEFTREITHIIQLQEEYTFDKDIQQLSVLSPIMSDYETRVAILNIQKKMQTLSYTSPYIQDVRLYMPTERKIIHPEYIEYGIPQQPDEFESLLNHKEYPIIVWNNQLTLIERYPTGLYLDGNLPLYWVEIVLDKSSIQSALSQIVAEQGGNEILSDLKGEWAVFGNDEDTEFAHEVLHNGPLHMGSAAGQKMVTINHQSYMAAYERSATIGLQLTLFIPEKVVMAPLMIYKIWFIVLIVTAVTIIILFAYGIYLFLQRPLQQLIRMFWRVQDGEFDVHLVRKSKDEFYYLYQQFNQMILTIQSLIRDVYEQGIRWQRAELRHLQAQINPHFLYNTFYRLHRLVQDNDTENLKRYTQLLGSYLKYIARNVDEETPLELEVHHAKTFADILKMRFGQKLQIQWTELPLHTRNWKVPRLIIQPIVENAFEYGLEELEGIGFLRFTCKASESELTMAVEDNGENLTPDRLEEMKSWLIGMEDNIETTGLLNVHRRLRLKFGVPYGISLFRSELGGLRVEVTIPQNGG